MIVEPTVLDCGEVVGNGDCVAGHADVLLRVLLDKGLSPLVLVLPRLPRHIETPSPGMLAWAGVASALGVAVFDGAEIIRQLAEREGKAHADMWRDANGHHTAAAGQTIGLALSTFVADAVLAFPAAAISGPPPQNLSWRVLSGKDLAMSADLPRRVASTALVSIESVVMCAGDVIRCEVEADEMILGLAVNYGEMNPCEGVLLEVVGAKITNRTNLSHRLLPPEVTHKTRLLFRSVNATVGSGAIFFPACAENARFSKDREERLEISAVLVGKAIFPIKTWVDFGAPALLQSHAAIESFLQACGPLPSML